VLPAYTSFMHLSRLVLVVTAVGALQVAWTLEAEGQDKIYRCDRETPLFTNRASYGCAEYHPQGLVAIAPNATMFFGSRPSASSGPSAETTATRSGQTGQDRLCRLYDEWVQLNERTAGGLRYEHTDQVVRWQALAKIFSSIGVPEKECRP
jgi:hypothetical protein